MVDPATTTTPGARRRRRLPRPAATTQEERGTNAVVSHRNQLGDLHPVDQETKDQQEEGEESYRRRVYGSTGKNDSDSSAPPLVGAAGSTPTSRISSSPAERRNLSHQLSDEFQRRRSSIHDALPTTRRGWFQLGSAIGTAILGYELCLQHHLTSPPTVYGQISNDKKYGSDVGMDRDVPLGGIYRTLTADPDTSILLRTIQPSLVVGTRGMLSSMAAYLRRGPPTSSSSSMAVPPLPPSPPQPPPGRRTAAASDSPPAPSPTSRTPSPPEPTAGPHRFRELVTMPADGAVIALDWQVPTGISPSMALHGPIARPVVLVVHGINNHAGFGYVQSLLRACTDRGWMAVGINMRGAAPGVPLATPRSYTGAYTGDLRGIVQTLSGRLTKQNNPNPPPNGSGESEAVIFLVGHSLGANLVTKYLGEEGLSGTLPLCVAGGVGLGNPMLMSGLKPDPLFSPIMALGVKKTLVEQLFALQPMASSNASFRSALQRAFTAWHLGDFDRAMAPVLIRNDSTHPFATRIGYDSADAYWTDASSYRNVPHISVPTLQVVAADDFLIYQVFRGRLHYCLNNPYVMVVETKCGGHLGWQESPPNHSRLGWLGSSWSDVVTCDFVDAVLQNRQHRRQHDRGKDGATSPDGGSTPAPDAPRRELDDFYATVPRSRL